jgi:hypothetical protein
MSVPIMIAAAGLSAFGNIKANMDQAAAIRQNLVWARHQESFMNRAFEREERLFRDQAQAVQGSQATAAGAAGLEMSGSVMDVMQSTYAAAQDEIAAMRDSANMQRMQMSLNMKQMKTQADRLGSFGWNALQATTTGLNAYAGMKSGGLLDTTKGAPSMSLSGTRAPSFNTGNTSRSPSSFMQIG